MELHLDGAAPQPPYEQIRAGVVAQVADGTLVHGQRLPAVRRLAASLQVAPGTVARAYRALESDGIVETRGRAGTFVAPSADPVEAAAAAAARAYAVQIHRLGLPAARAVALAERALEAVAQEDAG